MSYTVLARKLRPAGFDALVGQDHVIKALTHALDHDRLHHAYLFTGTRGVGKTTIARILAKCLNCESGVSSSPCGECSVCQEVSENRFIDLIEVDAASRTGIDDTRDLLDNAQYLPARGRYKVYLIDEVHMLSRASFNALLKTLEEPPPHVKFLLATTDPKKVPVTVLSRCLQFQLKNLSEEAMYTYLGKVLAEESIAVEESALNLIARSAQGSMRDALSITDQAIAFGGGALTYRDVADMLGAVGRDELDAVMMALASGRASEILRISEGLAERSADFPGVLSEVIGALHAQAVQHALNQSDQATFDADTVQLFYQIAVMGYSDMGIVPDPRTAFEMTLLRMLTFAPDDRQVPRLEAADEEPSNAPADAAGAQSAAEDPQIPVVADKPIPSTSAVSDTGKPADGVVMPDDLAGFWYDMVAALPLTGVGRMIVEHSVYVGRSEDCYQLVLDQAHDMLLGEAQVAAIGRAITEHTGAEVKVSIRTGTILTETPAARSVRLKALRQAEAEKAMESDAAVQSLLTAFGGQLDGVRPTEADDQGRSA
jgi:DNA polymerase-3 subunit gamma/tau